jgi:Mg-chelatase subunit ChlI
MPRSIVFPFSALVGQEKMKLALVLNVIDPSIDGVLIRGERGTAKSTAVRALATLMPEISVVEGCAFGCDPSKPGQLCSACLDLQESGGKIATSTRKMRVVELPVGATEDRVVGSIDMERALKTGEMHFEPGILGRVHRGFLYVDEVNLLEDHLVDVLLDSAAMGVNRIEREGISFAHPSNFVLVGTMNPEEGDLRPQLMDRFGLCADVVGISDLAQRVDVIRRRREYERDPAGFRSAWEAEEKLLGERILAAETLLPRVAVDDETLETIAGLSITLGADGHRADLAMYKAVASLAAFRGRVEVVDDDIRDAAALVYPHRMNKSALEERILSEEEIVTSIAKSREEQKLRRTKAASSKKKLI